MTVQRCLQLEGVFIPDLDNSKQCEKNEIVPIVSPRDDEATLLVKLHIVDRSNRSFVDLGVTKYSFHPFMAGNGIRIEDLLLT